MDVSSLFSVKDKVVLVTGGAKGIGYMISSAFVKNGARVYISSRDGAACEKAAAELNTLGSGTAIALPADFQSLDACKALAAELAKREQKLHVIVHNSGAAWGDSIETFPDSAWTKLLTLNLQRVFTLTQLLLPLLEASAEFQNGVVVDPARVIHIGSIDALRVPVLNNFAYSAAKAGLHHLSRHLATVLGPKGITSNTIACGPFPSKMMKAVLNTMGDEIRGSNPLSRIGTPEDVGGTCLYLASRAGAWTNGATIALDGGQSLLAKL
ncbi:reductase-like protein [Mariannaea sp. PMI_226]|nr:reductase-like protein [Mariannaea sp. PMI_226]